jgi:hypothetical protein
MSRRTDQKLQEVVVGRYAYRHEAEFAAGFLRDAGIPHRLQIDDPSLGIMLSTSAVLRVLAMDERRAREALEDTPVRSIDASKSVEVPRRIEPTAVRSGRRRAGGGGSGRPSSNGRLVGRERLLAGVGGLGLLGLAVSSSAGAVAAVGLVAGSGLSLAALLGRAPGPIKRLLAALGGEVS